MRVICTFAEMLCGRLEVQMVNNINDITVLNSLSKKGGREEALEVRADSSSTRREVQLRVSKALSKA